MAEPGAAVRRGRRSLRSSLFGVAAAASEWAAKAGRLSLYFAAGALRRADLDRMSRLTWDRFLASEEEALSGLDPWEHELYHSVVRPGDRVLIVGCGSGRDMLPFLDRGHQAVGVEPAPAAAALLRRLLAARGQPADVIEGFIGETSLPGTFDVVIFSWLCFSYIRESSRRIEALRRVAASLRRDGRIVLSYLAGAPFRHSRAIALTRFAARATGSDWNPEPNDVLGQRRSSRGERLVYYEHFFTDDEIANEVRAAGLRVLRRSTPGGIPALVVGV